MNIISDKFQEQSRMSTVAFFALLLVTGWFPPPVAARGIEAPPATQSRISYDAACYAGRLLIANGKGGISVYDIENPKIPRHLKTMKIHGSARSIAISRDYAFVAGGDRSLTVIDYMQKRAVIATAGRKEFSSDVAILGTKAYVTIPTRGIDVFDIRQPSRPVFLHHYRIAGTAASLAISGRIGVVCVTQGTIHCLDLGAARLNEVGRVETLGSPVAAVGNDRHVYVADYSRGLLGFDLSVPSRPKMLAKPFPLPNACGITMQADRLIVLSQNLGVFFFQPRVAGRLRQTHFLRTPGTPMGIAATQTYAYVACGASGVAIIFSPQSQPPALTGMILPK